MFLLFENCSLLTYTISYPCQTDQCHNSDNEMNKRLLGPCVSTGIDSSMDIIHGRNNFIANLFKLLFFCTIPALGATNLEYGIPVRIFDAPSY